MDKHFNAKFGPVPHVPERHSISPYIVILGQLLACIIILCVIQPPFVVSANAEVCVYKVISIGVSTAALTCTLAYTDHSPWDTLRSVCVGAHSALFDAT